MGAWRSPHRFRPEYRTGHNARITVLLHRLKIGVSYLLARCRHAPRGIGIFATPETDRF